MKSGWIWVVMFALCASAACAESWTGYLVDSKCYEAEERNVNPLDTMTYSDRDRDLEIRLCTPNSKTKTFRVVEKDGQSFKLNPPGRAKAVELVRKIGRKSYFTVIVTGEMSFAQDEVKVDSISVTK
jgi:hypothetical protein